MARRIATKDSAPQTTYSSARWLALKRWAHGSQCQAASDRIADLEATEMRAEEKVAATLDCLPAGRRSRAEVYVENLLSGRGGIGDYS